MLLHELHLNNNLLDWDKTNVTPLTLVTLEGGDNWKPRGQKRAPDQTREETTVTEGESCTCAKHTLTKRQRSMNEHQRTFYYTHTQQKSTGTHIPTASLQSIHITNTGMMCHQLTVAPYKEIRMVRVGGAMKQSDPVTLIRDEALITLPSSTSHEWTALIFNTEILLTQFPAKPLSILNNSILIS